MEINTRRDLQILAAFVLLTHLPFLIMPVQGDDEHYLKAAQHFLIDPLHPHNFHFVSQGKEVWMIGYPHPPLNSVILGSLVGWQNGVNEPLFHSVYAILSLLCAGSMYALARRFSKQPLLASLFFLAVPAFWIASNSFESDLPFLAFLLAGMALFVHGHQWWAMIPLALSGLAAYQSLAIIPVLWLLRRGYLQAMAPAIGVIGYQLFERATTGVFPLLTSTGYMNDYGLQRLQAKLLNAASLTSHLAWVAGPLATFEVHWALLAGLPAALLDWNPLFWCSFALGVLILVRAEGFLGWWLRIFFAAALVLFFAGSARYLLPLAPAVCMLAANRISEERLTYAVVAQMMLAGVLTLANYQHWQGYKDFVAEHASQVTSAIQKDRRVWTDAEWGLRFYAEELGAMAMRAGQPLQSGELLIHSRFANPSATGSLQLLSSREIRPSLPFRLLGGKSGWSTVALGVRPFDISMAPVDVISLYTVIERPPTVSFLPMSAPETEYQLLSGFYNLENRSRWMGREARAVLVSKNAPLEVVVYASEPKEFTITADGRELLRTRLETGLHTLTTPTVSPSDSKILVRLEVDKATTAPGDARELGVVVQSVGFR
jgi:hypothetical protein